MGTETEETEKEEEGNRVEGGNGMKSRRDGVHRERQRGIGKQRRAKVLPLRLQAQRKGGEPSQHACSQGVAPD